MVVLLWQVSRWINSFNVEHFTVDNLVWRSFTLLKNPLSNTSELKINWLENYEWLQFDLANNIITIRNDCNIEPWDTISVKYYY